MKIDPNVIMQKLVEKGEDWAQKEAAANVLEESRKSILAQIALKQEASSWVQAENMARAHPEYREHVEAMVAAREAANLAKVRYDAAKTWAALKQTQAANLRAEMTLR